MHEMAQPSMVKTNYPLWRGGRHTVAPTISATNKQSGNFRNQNFPDEMANPSVGGIIPL